MGIVTNERPKNTKAGVLISVFSVVEKKGIEYLQWGLAARF